MRPLAVTTTSRIDALPDVPSLSDFLPGYEAEGWLGMGAPTGTPQAIIDTLNKQINDALADDKISNADRYRRRRARRLAGGFRQVRRFRTAKWGKVIRTLASSRIRILPHFLLHCAAGAGMNGRHECASFVQRMHRTSRIARRNVLKLVGFAAAGVAIAPRAFAKETKAPQTGKCAVARCRARPVMKGNTRYIAGLTKRTISNKNAKF